MNTTVILFVNEIKSIFKYSKVLLFPDDLKIILEIASMENTFNLQKDLEDQLTEWCKIYGLKLNFDKYFQITFSKDKLHFQYNINNIKLKSTSIIKDLRFYIDSNLSSSHYINSLFHKTLARFPLRVIYYSFICPKLMYGSEISNLYFKKQSDPLK